jgi:hypothetical protein
MTVGPQLTKCVDRHDYENPDFTPEIIAAATALVSAFFLGPAALLAALPAGTAALETVLEFLLNGKLVCLNDPRRMVVAAGRVSSFETVESKSFPDSIDNDFSFNIVLTPNRLDDFAQDKSAFTGDVDHAMLQHNWDIAKAGPQGGLITEQVDMPEPFEVDASWGHYKPYSSTFKGPHYGNITDPALLSPTEFFVPVFHCECEGSRIHDMLEALETITDPLGTGICKLKILGIPIGKAICAIVSAALLPIVVAALLVAWFAADDGAAEDALQSGTLEIGNLVLVTGRWTWDGGHQGWNEIHAVRTIQILDTRTDDPVVAHPEVDVARWTDLVTDVPPRDPDGGRPDGMTPEQEATYDGQRQPEHQWVLHPLVDGCDPGPIIT